MQPEPAAVMACFHSVSCTSPAENTPSTLVMAPLVTFKNPLSSISSCPANRSLRHATAIPGASLLLASAFDGKCKINAIKRALLASLLADMIGGCTHNHQEREAGSILRLQTSSA